MKDTALIFAFIEVESNFKTNAFLNDRSGGSYGLMQIDLRTAEDRGYTGNATGLYEPYINIKYGTAILDWIAADLTKHDIYSIANLAASYNSGLHHVINGGTDPEYVAKITAAYAKWQEALGLANIGIDTV